MDLRRVAFLWANSLSKVSIFEMSSLCQSLFEPSDEEVVLAVTVAFSELAC